MALSDHRTPVLIGVGAINRRGDAAAHGNEAVSLMVESLRKADDDAGGGILARADSLSIVRALSGPAAPHDYVAVALNMTFAVAETTAEPSGESPVKLLNDAANRIATGQARIVAIAGGEALAPLASAAPRTDSIRAALDGVSPFLKKYGIVMPLDVYPFYEHASRAAWGQSFSEAAAESGAIWAALSACAAENPDAWLHQRWTPEAITAPAVDNPMVNFPYTRRLVANSRVNQGAAMIVTSLAEARALGIPEDRLIYVGAGAAAHESDDYLVRDSYAASTGMATALIRALALNRLEPADLDHIEFYSCFPCIPKMARRIIDWPIDRPVSAYGGLTFGGGPIGNCMTHAVVAMVHKLRGAGTHGLIFANGGFATHNHAIILSRYPPPTDTFPQDYDYGREAAAARKPAPAFTESYSGPAQIETYSVPYGRAGRPSGGAIIARNPAGERFVARVLADDDATLALLTGGEGEPIGTSGWAIEDDDGYVTWRSSGPAA